tara:strand:- start:1385 stop:2077 length:693 start_codon:yes stop_codon:yes gene_type:complete
MINHPAAPQDGFSFSNKINYDPATVMIVGAGASAVSNIMAGEAAMDAGRYQKSIADRNANIYDNKADQALEIGERNVAAFNKSFKKIQASTEVGYIASGVQLRGTPLEVLESNLEEAELERLNIMYDARVQSYDFKEQAAQSRMQGELAMYQARQQRTASYLNAAGNLINVYGTNKLISTQATNQNILTDQMFKNQTKLIDQTNTLNQKLYKLNLQNQYKLEDKYGSLLK